MSHATHRARLRDRFESIGKCPLDESGKHRVNGLSKEPGAGEYGNRSRAPA